MLEENLNSKTVIEFNPKQLEIIDSVFKQGHNKLFIHGGVRAGKSWVVLYMIDMICRYTPGMTAVVGRKTFEALHRDTFEITDRDPAIFQKKYGAWKNNHHEYHYKNGSKIFFMHFDKPDLMGMKAGLIYFEQAEEISYDDYKIVETRLSQWGGKNPITINYLNNYKEQIAAGSLLTPKNYVFVTANPRSCWVKDEFVDKEAIGFKSIHLSIYDNLINLPSEEIDRINRQSDAYKSRFYLGSWEFASGRIYSEFNNDNLVGGMYEEEFNPSELKNGRNKYKCLIGIDPALSKSKFAVLFSIVLPDNTGGNTGNTYYVFDELVYNGRKVDEQDHVDITEIIKEIKDKIKEWRINPLMYIDYAANRKEIISMNSISGVFRENGLMVQNCNKGIELDGIYRIKAMLKNKKIMIHPRCKELIKEFALFSWHPTIADTTLDQDNDCLDSLRYIINSNIPANQQGKDYVALTPEQLLHEYSKELFSPKNDMSKPLSRKTLRTGMDYGLF